MKKKILIFGAGAIGRGFIAPLFHKYNYEINFADIDLKLIKKLRKRNFYHSCIIKKKKYIFQKIFYNKSFDLKTDKIVMSQYDLVFSCVGPDNCYKNFQFYKKAKLLISCENDMNTVDKIKKLTDNKNIFFGIPDVITSNTASKSVLNKDNLTVISEDGILVLENFKKPLPKEIIVVNKQGLYKHWISKLYIHNAPHAIAAYLGHNKKYTFIHECMQDRKIKKIVTGSIREITKGLINCEMVDKKFANYYMNKELSRFSNKLLYDPVTRVARDPIRKLNRDNRLIKGFKVALFNNKLPYNCAKGIMSALMYYDKQDEQSKQIKYLKNNLGISYALQKVSGLDKDDPLISFVIKQKNIK